MIFYLNTRESNWVPSDKENYVELQKQDKFKKFQETLSIWYYKEMLQSEDIKTQLNLRKQLYKMAHNHENADMAFDFFDRLGERQEIVKLIHSRYWDLSCITILKYHRELIKEIDLELDSEAVRLLYTAASVEAYEERRKLFKEIFQQDMPLVKRVYKSEDKLVSSFQR